MADSRSHPPSGGQPPGSPSPRAVFVSHAGFFGGAERVLVETIQFFLDWGWDVGAILGAPGLEPRIPDGAWTTVIPHDLPGPAIGSLRQWRSFRRSFAHLMAQQRPQLVVFNTLKSYLLAYGLPRTGAKRMVQLHDYRATHGLDSGVRGWLICKLVGRGADRLVAVSEGVARDWGRAGGRMIVVPNATSFRRRPEPEMASNSGGRRVLLAGRIDEWKGQGELVDAVAVLSRRRSDFEVRVVGGPTRGKEHLLAELRDRIAARGLEKMIVLRGFREDVAEEIAASDVVLHLSTKPEAFGLVIIEAMALGKAVLASNIGGGPLEIITHGQDGLLVDPTRAEDVADALEQLMDDGALRRSLGERGAQTVEERFRPERREAALRLVVDALVPPQRASNMGASAATD